MIMQSRRSIKWDNDGRSQNKRPTRVHGKWQARVPSWEKQFCKVVGSLDWDKLLQRQEFMFLYENVVKWDDSACEEAFCNAKKRFFAEINGHSCDISPPDPNLYIDEIKWDLEEKEVDSEELGLDHQYRITAEEDDHETVIIFGDSLLPYQEYPSIGWGNTDDNMPQQQVPTAYNNISGVGWPDCYSNNVDRTRGDSWNNDNTINNSNYEKHKIADGRERGIWNSGNTMRDMSGGGGGGEYVSSYKNPNFKKMHFLYQ